MNFKEKLGRFPQVKTSNFKMRQIREDDAEELVKYYSNEKVYRYLDWYGPKTVEKGIEVINRWNRGFEEGWIIRFAIADLNTDKIIGSIFLSEFEGARAEIGYELSEEYWRLGIMSTAVGEMLRLGFDRLGLNRIQAFVCDENEASRNMLKNIGFKEEGYLRGYERHSVTGECKDMWVYGILKDDNRI